MLITYILSFGLILVFEIVQEIRKPLGRTDILMCQFKAVVVEHVSFTEVRLSERRAVSGDRKVRFLTDRCATTVIVRLTTESGSLFAWRAP